MSDYAKNIGSGAATGAALGSIVPGVGNVIGGAAGAIVGLGTSIFGSIKAGKKRRNMENLLRQQESENNIWYNANALSDYTQRADAQNLLRNMRENLAKRDRSNANMSVVSGATPEQQAAAKEQSNQIVSNVYGNLGAMGQQWKDRITNQYLSRKYSLGNSNLNLLDQQARNYETLMNNGLNTFSDGVKSFAGGLGGSYSPSVNTNGIKTTAIPQPKISQVAVPQYSAPTHLEKLF